MRAAAILGLGCSTKDLTPFQTEKTVEWRLGLPGSREDADVILLFGGDGTVHRHLGQLSRLGLPVLVVPAGSGNDFAASLGLGRMRDSLAAWQRLCRGGNHVREIDLGVISPIDRAGEGTAPSAEPVPGPRYFCCVAGVGLDSEVARRANGLPRWLRSHGGYLISAVPTIFSFAPLRIKILVPEDQSTDTRNINVSGGDAAVSKSSWSVRSDQPTILAAFANTPFYGGGMKIAPRAKMNDGLLDVCIVRAIDPCKLFCLFPTVYSGRHLNVREVEYFNAARVRVETEHPLDVYADGEYVGRTPIEVSVRRAALRVVTL